MESSKTISIEKLSKILSTLTKQDIIELTMIKNKNGRLEYIINIIR